MNSNSEEFHPHHPTAALSDAGKATGKRKKPKALKDPLAPKRPLSAFFQFSQEERAVVLAELGNISVAEIGKELGKRWALLDEVKKSKYENKVVEAKARYDEEMKTYQPSKEFLDKKAELDRKNAQKANRSISDYFSFMELNWRKVAGDYNLTEVGKVQDRLWKTWNEDKENVGKKKGRNKTNSNGVKMNTQTAFSIFQKEMKEKLEKVAGRTISDMEVSGLVAEKWSTLDQKLKDEYEKQAGCGLNGIETNKEVKA